MQLGQETVVLVLIRYAGKYPLRNQCIDPDNYTKPEAWKCVL